MKSVRVVLTVLMVQIVLTGAPTSAGATVGKPEGIRKPPKGFTALFNGKDFTNWRGRQPNLDPEKETALSPEEHAKKQAEWNAARDAHWRVDQATQEIVSDGQSPHLATVKDYADFELYVDWLMVSHNGDSGIYLRGTPQVQIWDPDNPREVANGAQKGSGALWNDKDGNPGKWPLVKADKPIGEWNTFHIKMVGAKVWVWFNDRLTVDGQIMDNWHDRNDGFTKPIPAKGPIELQTHGSEIRFRNVFIREIPAAKR
jgi:hypothetical protein